MSESSRERYEHPEMQAAEVQPWAAWAFAVSTALLILAVPAWRQATTGHGELTIEWTEPVDGLNRSLLLAVERFEHRLEEGSAVRAATLPTIQRLLLRFGGVGNETVYAGPGRGGEGGLVLRSGFDHLAGPAFLDPAVLERRIRNALSTELKAPEPDPRPALLAFSRQLEARGIELIFLPVPTKPAIRPETLGAGQADRPLQNPSLPDLLDALEQEGVEVLDPSELLRDLADSGTLTYLDTDSHWSPAAVDAVARALAERIEQLVDLPPADRAWTRTPLERRGRGDLWRSLALPPEDPIYDEETVTVEEVTSWDGRLWSPRRDAPVLLLGDSFTTVFSDPALHWGRGAGLAEQLAYHLGRDVDRIARPDGSSDQVRRELAERPEGLGSARVVVYQMATRELSFGDWPVLDGSRASIP